MLIAQISDPHISLTDAATDRTYATAEHLQRAVRHLMHQPLLPDIVIVTGDCVDGGSKPEYERFRDTISPLTMPVYIVPGNHDDRDTMLHMFGPQGASPLAGFVQYVVDAGPVRLIALDSHVPGSDGGALDAARLDWLEQRLAEEPERPTILFLHHPPFQTGLTILDDIGLEGADALGAIVARYSNVERVVAGHVHASMQRRFYGTLAMTCPSTGQQLLIDLQHPDQVTVVMSPPACLLHAWSDHTGLLTHTSIIGEYGQNAGWW